MTDSTTRKLLSRFDTAPAPSASATWWSISAGALAAQLMRTGGVCRIETPGVLYDITLEDGRIFLGCRPTGRCAPGRAPEPLTLVESSVGSLSLVTGAKVTEAVLCQGPLTDGPAEANLPGEGSEEP